MPTFLLESPWIVGVVGLFFVGVLVFAWINSGRPIFWKIGAGVALATLLLLLLNILVQTEEERLRSLVDKIARDLEANRFSEVTKIVHPDASEEMRSLKNQLESVAFSYVRIKKIHGIELGTGKPETASIRMNVVVSASRGPQQATVPRWVRVHLEKWKGDWRVVDYEHRDPQYEMLNRQGRDRLDSFQRR